MKQVFLETHNIKNQFTGLGQFNYHLAKGLYAAGVDDFKMVLHATDIHALKNEFGDYFNYKKYYSFKRYNAFSIRTKYDLWHSVNQNTKLEPHHNLPYLLTVHDVNFYHEISDDMDHPRNVRFKNKLARSNAITYISKYAKEDTHRHFEVPNVPEYVIYNGNTIVETDIPDSYRPKVLPKGPFLFTIGEINARKNFHTLVDMLQFLPDISLIVSGKDKTEYADKIRELIAKNKLADRVFLTGKISELDKQFYLKNCMAFVFPSLLEGFGIPPIEAMHFGKPVFLANRTSLPEIGGEHAFYWEHFEPGYMAGIFEEGMAKYEKNRGFYTEAYKKRTQLFNWNKVAQEYIKVYRELL